MISGLGDELIRKINQRTKWFEVGLILGRPLLFSAPHKLKAEKTKTHLSHLPGRHEMGLYTKPKGARTTSDDALISRANISSQSVASTTEIASP